MAQVKQFSKNSNSSNRYSSAAAGEESARSAAAAAAARPATVLASCYVVDSMPAAGLRAFHYCTTPLTGAECPPLAAITAANELAVLPKKRAGTSSSPSSAARRRGGAALRIREDCERLFCETMAAVFQGERNTAGRVSILTGVYNKDSNNKNDNYSKSNTNNNGQLCTPPDDSGNFATLRRIDSAVSSSSADTTDGGGGGAAFVPYATPTAWLEVWDYAGYASFRAFLAEDRAGATSLFAFFDASVLSRDLKQALVALIELADTLACAHLVLCVDRAAPAEDAEALLKGLQWAGFSLTTLDAWTGGQGVDVTSPRWLFMGMEL